MGVREPVHATALAFQLGQQLLGFGQLSPDAGLLRGGQTLEGVA